MNNQDSDVNSIRLPAAIVAEISATDILMYELALSFLDKLVEGKYR